jgi:hypothetical protein
MHTKFPQDWTRGRIPDVSGMSGMCCASSGLWRLRRWGLWTAISILSINLLGDTLNAFLLRDWRTLIGLPIAGLMIVYLLRNGLIFHH